MLNIYDLLTNSLSVTFLNEPEFISLHTVKWFEVLLSSIILFNIVCIQLKDFKYFYQTQMILLSINHLFAYS